MMKKHFAAFALATTALAAPAFAGGLDEPIVAAPVMVAPPAGTDWTGFYVGGQVGTLNAEVVDTPIEGSGTIYGVHAGYNYDLGSFVIGGEVDYDMAEIDLEVGGVAIDTINSVARVKIKGGYDAGPALVYATAGLAQLDLEGLSETQDGNFYGAGLSFMATQNIMVGGEVLKHSFESIDGGPLDAEATTFTLRASFRF